MSVNSLRRRDFSAPASLRTSTSISPTCKDCPDCARVAYFAHAASAPGIFWRAVPCRPGPRPDALGARRARRIHPRLRDTRRQPQRHFLERLRAHDGLGRPILRARPASPTSRRVRLLRHRVLDLAGCGCGTTDASSAVGIDPNPHRPRSDMDGRPLAEFIASIREHGLL